MSRSQWLTANGGPLALVVLGLTLAGFTTGYGWALVAVGAIWWVGWQVIKRLPWGIHRKTDQAAAAVAKAKIDNQLLAATEIRQKRRLNPPQLYALVNEWIAETKKVLEEVKPDRVGYFMADTGDYADGRSWPIDQMWEAQAHLRNRELQRLDRHITRLGEILHQL